MILDEIIEKIHNLTYEQQKDVLEYLNSIQKKENRGCLRLSTQLEIDAVVDGDRIIQADTRDISSNGLFIKTSGANFCATCLIMA